MSGLWKLRYELSVHVKKVQQNVNWHISTEAKICQLRDRLIITLGT